MYTAIMMNTAESIFPKAGRMPFSETTRLAGHWVAGSFSGVEIRYRMK